MKRSHQLMLDIDLASEHAALFDRTKALLSESLKETLVGAGRDRRLTCGLDNCGQLLQMNPESIILCVLPDDKCDDVAMHIHFTLIEAFCLENDILVLKVDSAAKLEKVYDSVKVRHDADGNWPSDFNCMLVEDSVGELSEAEEYVLEFGRTTCDMLSRPIVELNI